MKDGEVTTRRSGPGFRASLPIDGEIVVSLWGAEEESDLTVKAYSENIVRMQAVDRREHAMAQEFAEQQWAEFLKIRARA